MQATCKAFKPHKNDFAAPVSSKQTYQSWAILTDLLNTAATAPHQKGGEGIISLRPHFRCHYHKNMHRKHPEST